MSKGMNFLPPDISTIISKSQEDRTIIYRRFLADLRLMRLYFHLTLLDYLSGIGNPHNKNNFSKELENFVSYFDQMESWLENLAKEGLYPEFKTQCLQETKAIRVIIQSYEDKMIKD
jgi:hypothetical protein